MYPYNLPGNAESKSEVVFAGMCLILAEKTLEHLFFGGIWYTWSVIGNGQGNVAGSKRQGKCNAAGGRRVAQGIVHKDREYLRDPLLITQHRRAFLLGKADMKGQLFFPGQVFLFFIGFQQ